jgi:DNA polymerase III subunit delta
MLDRMPPETANAGNPGKAAAPPPLTLVTGDEDLLTARHVADVLASAQRADPEAAVEEYAAADFTAGHVLELRNPPLFGGTRVVVVRGLNELPDEVLDALLPVLEQPIPEVVFVGIGGGRERKQVAAIRKLAGRNVRSAAKITRPKERRAFVMDEAKRVGVRLTDAAGWALLDAIGADLRSLSGAVAQLREVASSGRNPRAPLDEEDVARLFRGKAETRGFAVADAVITGDTAAALSLLRSALETGLDPVPIVSVIASSLRDLARITGETSSGRHLPRAELARRLGMPDWKLDRVKSSARQWSDAALSAALQAAARADAGVKGVAADPVFVLERLVLEATSARNGRAALAAGGVRR